MQNPSAQATTTPTAVPGLSAPNAAMAPPGQSALPFRRAVGPVRTRVSVQDTGTVATSQTPVTQVLPGTGYMVWLDETVTLTVTGNSSTNTVQVTEDAPWSALASNVLDDGAAPFVNVPGFDLYLANLYGGFGLKQTTASADTNVFNPFVTGSTASGAGTMAFTLRMPFAINDRDLIGLLGNQDRQTKYNLRSDIAVSTQIYQVVPTVLPTYTIARTYGYVPVPGALSADRRPQEVVPPHYGVIHYINSVQSDSVPVPSATVNHFLHNLNNALRAVILVFRAGTGLGTGTASGPRNTANSNLPTRITMYAGSDPVFIESAAERRVIMYQRYGFDAPPGVLVYDAIRDFGHFPGYELGDEYIYLGDLSEAQFEIVYPAGFTSGGSLRFITSTLAIPPGLDLTAMSHA